MPTSRWSMDWTGFTYASSKKWMPSLRITSRVLSTPTRSGMPENTLVSNSLFLSGIFIVRMKIRHIWGFNLVNTKIDSAVSVYNPGISTMVKEKYGIRSWPIGWIIRCGLCTLSLKGIIFESGLTRRGLDRDMNLWQLYAKVTRSWQLGRKLWFGIQNNNVLKLPLANFL